MKIQLLTPLFSGERKRRKAQSGSTDISVVQAPLAPEQLKGWVKAIVQHLDSLELPTGNPEALLKYPNPAATVENKGQQWQVTARKSQDHRGMAYSIVCYLLGTKPGKSVVAEFGINPITFDIAFDPTNSGSFQMTGFTTQEEHTGSIQINGGADSLRDEALRVLNAKLPRQF